METEFFKELERFTSELVTEEELAGSSAPS